MYANKVCKCFDNYFPDVSDGLSHCHVPVSNCTPQPRKLLRVGSGGYTVFDCFSSAREQPQESKCLPSQLLGLRAEAQVLGKQWFRSNNIAASDLLFRFRFLAPKNQYNIYPKISLRFEICLRKILDSIRSRRVCRCHKA